MVRHDACGRVEPERREGGEDPSLVGDRVVEHDVEHREPIRRDHEVPVVAHVVELADLPRVAVRQADAHAVTAHRVVVERGEDAVDVGQSGGEVEALVELRGRQPRSHVGILRPARRGTGFAASHVSMALRCTTRYASSRDMPPSTSARSTGWLNTSP